MGPRAELLPPVVGPEGMIRHFGVSRGTADRLAIHVALLERWAKVLDLVAPSTLAQVWHRHVADSAQLVGLAPTSRRWMDLGTGAGFPGLVVAIMQAEVPGFVMHLIESNARKCAFLREVARATGTAVEIHHQRIESIATRATVAGLEVVSARAVAPMDRLLDLAAPLLVAPTRGLFMKGREVEREIESARKNRRIELVLHQSVTDSGGRIVEVRRSCTRQKGDRQ